MTDTEQHIYAVVEIMGRRQRAGIISDAQVGGATLLRIQHPSRLDHEGNPLAEYYAPSALFAVRPCSAEDAEEINRWAWTDRLLDEHGVPTHALAERFTCPTWSEPGVCICGAALPSMTEWDNPGRDWASVTCAACGRGYVDEEEYIAIYDEGFDADG